MFFLTSCTALFRSQSVENPKVEVIKGQWITLPKPSELNFNVTATQILTAQYKIKNKIKSYTSQVQVEKTSSKLVLVAVAGWGGEIFSIDYNGVTIKTSSLPMPNAALGIQHILTDFIFTYASKKELDKILSSTSIKLINKSRERLFVLNGKTIIKIDYQNDDPWKGQVVLQNLKLHYTIIIKTVFQSDIDRTKI